MLITLVTTRRIDLVDVVEDFCLARKPVQKPQCSNVRPRQHCSRLGRFLLLFACLRIPLKALNYKTFRNLAS